MADEQHDGSDGSDQSQSTGVSSAQPAASREIVDNVQELLHQDRSTAIVKAINFLVRNQQQEQQIAFLNQTISEAVEQQAQMQTDLRDRSVIESFMANLEAQNLATRKYVQEKTEAINGHVKLNELFRKQLRKEIGDLRLCTNEVKVRAGEIEDAGKKLHNSLQNAKLRLGTLKKQVSAASDLNAKVRADGLETEAEIRKTVVELQEMDKKMRAEMLDKESLRNMWLKELEQAKQTMERQTEAYNQIVSEQETLRQGHEQLKQSLDNEINRMEQHIAALQKELQQAYENAAKDNENKMKDLNQTIGSLADAKRQDEECITLLKGGLSEIERKVQDEAVREKELKEKLRKLTTEVEAVIVGAVPNLKIPKRTVLRKRKTPVMSTDDSQSSFHFDNGQSSSAPRL